MRVGSENLELKATRLTAVIELYGERLLAVTW